jgi:hypothetical protein
MVGYAISKRIECLADKVSDIADRAEDFIRLGGGYAALFTKKPSPILQKPYDCRKPEERTRNKSIEESKEYGNKDKNETSNTLVPIDFLKFIKIEKQPKDMTLGELNETTNAISINYNSKLNNLNKPVEQELEKKMKEDYDSEIKPLMEEIKRREKIYTSHIVMSVEDVIRQGIEQAKITIKRKDKLRRNVLNPHSSDIIEAAHKSGYRKGDIVSYKVVIDPKPVEEEQKP